MIKEITDLLYEFNVRANITIESLADIISDIAEPVRHGHWEIIDGTEPRRYGCSMCKKLSWTEDNYCSYCGAKMDEEG